MRDVRAVGSTTVLSSMAVDDDSLRRAFAVGNRIDGHLIEGVLGEGGFGRVFAARSPDGEDVALKVLRVDPERCSTVELEYLQNELEALTRLDHPAIVRVRGFGWAQERWLYLAMERVRGEALSSLLARRGRLDALEAIGIVGALADALAQCHARGVLHLDLKLDNVLVVDPHRHAVKILDFGLARLARGWTATRTRLAGTPAFMPPEALTGDIPDPRFDLYALGVMLYVMLSGRLPYEGGSVSALFAAKQSGAHIPLSRRVEGVPAAVLQWVERLLEPAPERRPSNAGLLATDLRRAYFETLFGHERASEATESVSVARTMLPLEGRDTELEELRRAWRQALEGGSAIRTIVGEAGLGKSRLVSTWLDEVRKSGFVVYARCRSMGQVLPYAPVREGLGRLLEQVVALAPARAEALRRATMERLGPDAALLVGMVPELATYLPRAGRTDPLMAGPKAIARAVAALFEAVVTEAPVAFVIEDVHWADDSMNELLGALSHRGIPGVCLLFTRRPPADADDASIVRLGPLAQTEHRRLLGRLLCTSDRELVDALLQAVPLLRLGNPWVSTQVVGDLERRGIVTRGSEAGLRLDMLAQYEAPDSLSEVLQRSVDRLSRESVEVLQTAAILGRDFDLGDLEGFWPRAQIGPALDEATALGLCRCDEGRCSFVHEVVVERLTGDLGPAVRSAMHRQCARVLEARNSCRGIVARHLELGGARAEALEAYLEAGREADELHDPSTAAACFRRAFELADASDPREARLRVQAVFEHVRVAATLGDTDQARTMLHEIETQAQDDASVVLMIESAKARMHYVRGELDEAVALSRRVLQATRDGSSPMSDRVSDRASVAPLNILGRAACVLGHHARAVELLDRGCSLARRHRDSTELSHSLGLYGIALGFSGRSKEAEARLSEGAELARRLGDPVRTLAALAYASVHGECSHDWERGVLYSAEALQFAREHAIGGLYHYLSLVFAGRHQFHVGQLARARTLLDAARAEASELGIEMGVSWLFAFAGDVAFVERDHQRARELYEQALERSERRHHGGLDDGDLFGGALARAGLAHVMAIEGASASAVAEEGERARGDLQRSGNRASMPHLLQRLAEASLLVGDREGAARTAEASREAFAELGLGVVDWWPEKPRGVPTSGSDNRSYWAVRPASERAGAQCDPTHDDAASATVRLREVTQAIVDSVREQRTGTDDSMV